MAFSLERFEAVNHERGGAMLSLIWILLAPDLKKKGELVGRVADGSSRGKIVFGYFDGRKAGEHVPVLVEDNPDQKFIRADYPFFATFTGGVLAEAQRLGMSDFPIRIKEADGMDWLLPLEAAKERFADLANRVIGEILARRREEKEKYEREEAARKAKEEALLASFSSPEGKALYRECKRHDWYHGYSDDARVDRAGAEHGKSINKMIDEMCSKGLREEAKRVWLATAPETMSFPPDDLWRKLA